MLRASIAKEVEHLQDYNSVQEFVHCTSTYLKSLFYQRPLYGILGYPLGRALDRKFNLTAKTGFKLRRIARSDLKIIKDRLNGFSSKIERQRENALFLLGKLEISETALPREREDCLSNYYQFPIRFRNTQDRNLVAEGLLAHGIDSAKYLDEVVELARSSYGYRGGCPKAEIASQTILVIPNHYTLHNKDMEFIAETFNKIVKRHQIAG
jgi:perosamine synthetase